MKFRYVIPAAVVFTASLVSLSAQDPWVTYEGKDGPGKGRHVVLLSGDEEYRGEEGLPMLAKILSQRHGFKCTVLFSVDADGTINPNNQKSISNPAALDSADAVIMALRFRKWPDADAKHFVDYFLAGKPIIALRTSTHAFDFPKDSAYAKYAWTSSAWKGGFGKQVLGETWVDHWAKHKVEATRGIIAPGARGDVLLRGVENVFGDTDVYEAYPPADANTLLLGQALKGMKPDSPPADYRRKRSTDKQEQGINDPMMPVAWKRLYKNEAGKENKILCTTMGSATDLQSEGLRRLIVNGVYWGVGLDVPAKADVTYVGTYKPTMYGFNGYQKGVKPADHALQAKPRAEAAPAGTAPILVFNKGDHVAIVGNALPDRMQHSGYFETLIHQRFPADELVFRNLSAAGDEVATWHRSENFGSRDQWLERVKADVIFAFYGFNESFKGYDGLEKFKADLDKFLKETRAKNYSGKGAPRVVLFGPVADERNQDPNYPDPRPNNERLRDYNDAMARVAADNKVAFVDLFKRSQELFTAAAAKKQSLTVNGHYLTPEGDKLLAPSMYQSLFGEPAPKLDEKLRAAVNEKNLQWHHRYRTVDGYNVYGGRSGLAYQPDKGGFLQNTRNPDPPYISNYEVMQEEMSQRDVITANRDQRVWAVAKGGDLAVKDENLPPVRKVPTNKPYSKSCRRKCRSAT